MKNKNNYDLVFGSVFHKEYFVPIICVPSSKWELFIINLKDIGMDLLYATGRFIGYGITAFSLGKLFILGMNS